VNANAYDDPSGLLVYIMGHKHLHSALVTDATSFGGGGE